jgi:hypothetical protein
LKVLAQLLLRIQIVWDKKPCRLVLNVVSEKLASSFGVEEEISWDFLELLFSETSTRHHIPGDLNVRQHLYEYLSFCS